MDAAKNGAAASILYRRQDLEALLGERLTDDGDIVVRSLEDAD